MTMKIQIQITRRSGKRKKKEAQQQQKKFAESDFKSAYEGQVVDGNIIKDMLKDEKVQEKDEVEK